MYRLKQDGDYSVQVYNFAGAPVVRLEGGFSEVIIMTFQNMSKIGETRGDDYMAGVVAGIMHMQMLRPDAFAVCPPVPDIGPDPRLMDDDEPHE